MTESTKLEPELIRMIQRISDSRKPISHTAALYHDLGIAGDDAYELVTEMAQKFGTSFAGLDFPAYFPNETEIGPISYWALKLGIYHPKERRLTIAHLLSVIERGSWFEPSS